MSYGSKLVNYHRPISRGAADITRPHPDKDQFAKARANDPLGPARGALGNRAKRVKVPLGGPAWSQPSRCKP